MNVHELVVQRSFSILGNPLFAFQPSSIVLPEFKVGVGLVEAGSHRVKLRLYLVDVYLALLILDCDVVVELGLIFVLQFRVLLFQLLYFGLEWLQTLDFLL